MSAKGKDGETGKPQSEGAGMDAVLRFARENWVFLVFVSGLLVAWFLLRTPATDLDSTDEFDRRVRSGHPVVVEFFSNT